MVISYFWGGHKNRQEPTKKPQRWFLLKNVFRDPGLFDSSKRSQVLLLNLHFWLLIPTLLHHRSGESIVSGAEVRLFREPLVGLISQTCHVPLKKKRDAGTWPTFWARVAGWAPHIRWLDLQYLLLQRSHLERLVAPSLNDPRASVPVYIDMVLFVLNPFFMGLMILTRTRTRWLNLSLNKKITW